MKRKALLYLLAGLILATAVGHALWRTTRYGGGDPEPSHYTYMSPADRTVEYTALSAKAENPGSNVSPEEYFIVLKRFELLSDAMARARLEESTEKLRTASGSKGYPRPAQADDEVGLEFLKRSWVNATQGQLRNTSMERIDKARTDSGVEAIGRSHRMPIDTFLAKSWAIVYFAGLLLAFVHFQIKNRALGGNILLASDPRFWMWLALWIPGLFRYPTAIDVKQQLLRAKRFATLVISTCLPLGAACATKRIKTPEEQRKNEPRTLHINASTTTWSKYIGGNGGEFHPATVQQSSITVSGPKGLSAGVWASVPLKQWDLSPNFGREVDVYAGWNGKLRGFNLGANFNYVGVTPVGKHRGDPLVMSFSAARGFKVASLGTLSPSFTIQHAMPTAGPKPREGTFLRSKIGWSLNKNAWSFGADAEIVHDTGAFGFNPGYFGKIGGNVGRQISKKLRIDAPLQFFAPISHLGDSRKANPRMGLTLSYAIR